MPIREDAVNMVQEPIRDIAHLGHVELYTPEPDESLWYFRDLLGMAAIHREDQSVYLRGYGDYATSTFKLPESFLNDAAPDLPDAPADPRVPMIDPH